MKFSLLVLSPPQSDSSSNACHFAEAIVSEGHQLYRVFFYQDGVLNAMGSENNALDSIKHRWQQLGLMHKIDLAVCSTAARMRRISNGNTNSQTFLQPKELLQGFTLSGLGQLADAAVSSDRLITFG